MQIPGSDQAQGHLGHPSDQLLVCSNADGCCRRFAVGTGSRCREPECQSLRVFILAHVPVDVKVDLYRGFRGPGA